ncbi:MAG: ABC transporter permease subunit, partial [Candidatus Latescibacteria bacterium]|nr:ABC transporter permease subunit [Candidatus Latescibacterota bacterium]
ASNQGDLSMWMERGMFRQFSSYGYRWNRPPEVLSPVVYGLSGVLGKEVRLHYEYVPEFEGSPLETDLLHAFLGSLDFALIVRIVLSLCVLLITYDSVCGEKARGTLRLYASFPTSRARIAGAKLVGTSLAVLVPAGLSFSVVVVAMVLSPDISLGGSDLGRLLVMVVVFALYLVVFAAFGLLASALTHRRTSAFLGLLMLWTFWQFIVPNVAVGIARNRIPQESPYRIDREVAQLRREADDEVREEVNRFFEANVPGPWETLSKVEQDRILAGASAVGSASSLKHDEPYQAALAEFRRDRHNRIRRQVALAGILSAVSPVGSVTTVAMDLARTGFDSQMQIEEALSLHQVYLARYVREKQGQRKRPIDDFVPFSFDADEPLSAVLERNTLHLLSLALLAILGFAGAYVAILRYDVR